jgi:uncharacterized metal-binding protein YceD (DUF177 family)
MKHSREFEIAWQGLKEGLHIYQYNISDKFMESREVGKELRDWDVDVTLNFDKKNSFFLLHFDIDGSVTVPCDRCGDDFKLRLWDEFDLVIKLTGEETKEVDEDDVVFIPRSETVIDLSNWIYEFIMLSVPLQRIHPDKADGTPGCNKQALKLLNKLSEPKEQTKKAIWKGLEELQAKSKAKKKTKNSSKES